MLQPGIAVADSGSVLFDRVQPQGNAYLVSFTYDFPTVATVYFPEIGEVLPHGHLRFITGTSTLVVLDRAGGSTLKRIDLGTAKVGIATMARKVSETPKTSLALCTDDPQELDASSFPPRTPPTMDPVSAPVEFNTRYTDVTASYGFTLKQDNNSPKGLRYDRSAFVNFTNPIDGNYGRMAIQLSRYYSDPDQHPPISVYRLEYATNKRAAGSETWVVATSDEIAKQSLRIFSALREALKRDVRPRTHEELAPCR